MHCLLINTFSFPIIDNSSCGYSTTLDASSYLMLLNWIPPPSYTHFLLWERFSKWYSKKKRKYLILTEILSSKPKGHCYLSRKHNTICVKGGFIYKLYIWHILKPPGKKVVEPKGSAQSSPGCRAQISGDPLWVNTPNFQTVKAGLAALRNSN